MGARKPGFLRKYFKRAHKTSPVIIVEQASLRLRSGHRLPVLDKLFGRGP